MIASLALLLAATASQIEVAAYYFPGYHADPRIDARKGRGWTEWNLTRAAKPRFDGHNQPRVPAWGYQDEADPREMAKKIAAAADHHLAALIFDWYWYEDKPYLSRALDDGFLKARNRGRIKFALMWANHDWLDCMPAVQGKPLPLIYRGAVDETVFGHVTDQAIRYFRQPNYWRVGGKPYYSIYEVQTLVAGLGGIEKTRAALDAFRAKAKAAGLPGIHLNAVGWGPLTPELVTQLGFDSVTDYTWVHHLGPEPYAKWASDSEAMWPQFQAKWPVPYFPNVSVGWDNTPRYSWLTNVTQSTPPEFESALAAAKSYLGGSETGPKVLTINSWNEWTEGSYLEPDTKNGLGYLEAIARVFKRQ
ncbi:MAG TPA: glycoside hydrolase family 99-like domain-containing protein [Fimbriimonadaceae bacterium]|nr:glycoside hydrolase family 99-like domain-containing protein [Fimbriimonadaceae bacterium]